MPNVFRDSASSNYVKNIFHNLSRNSATCCFANEGTQPYNDNSCMIFEPKCNISEVQRQSRRRLEHLKPPDSGL